MESMNRVAAFFRSFGFDAAAADTFAQRFEGFDEPLRRAQDAVSAWLAMATGAQASCSAGFAAARVAFVRADMAKRFPQAFLSDDVSDEVRAAFTQRPSVLPALTLGAMVAQDVRMLPVVDDVLRSVLPLRAAR